MQEQPSRTEPDTVVTGAVWNEWSPDSWRDLQFRVWRHPTAGYVAFTGFGPPGEWMCFDLAGLNAALNR